MREKLKALFEYEKIDKKAFCDYQYDIECFNLKSIKTIAFVGMVLSIFLVILCLPPIQILHLIQGYSIIAATFIVAFLISAFVLEKNPRLILPFYYMMMVMCLTVCIALGTYFQPTMPATSFVLFVIILPLFVVDYPYRVNIVVGVMCIVFLVAAYYFKTGVPLSLDIGNCIFYYLISMVASRQSITSKMSDIVIRQRLETKADIDVLTKLYNRGALELKAKRFLNGQQTTASVVVLDMDNFKYVNDTYGHHIGDEALMKVGNMLTNIFRKKDLICRFGGDEFVIFLPDLTDQTVLESKVTKIIEEANQLRLSVDEQYRFKMCIGIATYPTDGIDYDEVFKAADSAMFDVKKMGKDGYQFYHIEEIRKKGCIIVADDIEMHRAILKKCLTPEYYVLTAANGIEVLELLKQYKEVEMVITDIQMPEMDGFELVEQIKSEPKYSHKAIIAYTSYEDGKQEERLYQLGVDDFIYKAASPMAIKLRVRNVLKAKNTY